MFTTKLDDGTEILVRPVVPADRQRLLSGFEELSERSRFFRFLRAINRLSNESLERFTAEGTDDHRALGVLDIGGSVPISVAIGRYERFEASPEKAEMAVTVLDRYQGKGVGALLIGALAACAVRSSISTFVAFVHPENRGMIALMLQLGAERAGGRETELVYHLPLHRDASRYPLGRAGERLRLAYGLVPPP